MLQRKEFIEENDWVVVVESPNVLRLMQALSTGSFSNRNGHFRNADMIGKRYGSRLLSIHRDGYCALLAPTPHLWPEVVNFRTQILYQPDASLVTYFLQLKPGSVMIESGTGSGSLTTFLARAIAPHGHIHTFEFHAERVKKAQEDFIQNKLDHLITVRQRNILDRGFPYFPEGVDAAFIDLPNPHSILDSVDKSLRPQGRLCNFSPCIEQVQRVCVKLADLGYEEIFTVECLARQFEVVRTRPPQYVFGESCNDTIYQPRGYAKRQLTGDSVPSCEIYDDEYVKLNSSKRKKPVFTSTTAKYRGEHTEDYERYHQQLVRRANDLDTEFFITPETPDVQTQSDTSSDNTQQTDAISQPSKVSKPANSPSSSASNTLYQLPTTLSSRNKPGIIPPDTHVTRPAPIMRGHTGYLTFARKKASAVRVEGKVYAVPFSLEVLGVARPGEIPTDLDDNS